LIEPEAKLIAPGQLVSVTASIEDVPIFFTLDGSRPDSGSTPYSGPFPLNASTTVSAVAIGENGLPGPITARSYHVGTPNLLIIVGDAVGFGDLHCNGGVSIATPALDSLAADGIRFTQFTTAGPGAAASQFALLSGRVAARSGMGGNAPVAGASGWNAEEWTLAEMLRRRGYRTAFIGEWLLGNSRGSHPNDQGFQIFHGLPFRHSLNPPLEENREILAAVPSPGTLLDSLTQRAVDFLTTAPAPFALMFHPPALPAAGNSLAGPHGNRIEALDQAVSQLLTALDTHDLADDTLVLFLGNGGAIRTADGGSNGILRDGAGTTWEGGLRSPLIARLPGTLPASQMNLSLVWLPDLTPTLAALVGGALTPDRPLDGTPQPEALKGARTRPTGNETAYAFRHEGNAWQLATLRQGRWKSHLSIVNIDPLNDNPATGSQLYDLHVDAEERINRAGGQPAILNQLQSLATSFSATLPAAGTTDLPLPKPAVIDGISTSLESNASALRFEFTRPADSLDENYRIEHSDNLVAWENLAITPYLVSVTPAAGLREDLEILVPLGVPPIDGGRRFVRLHAERPANP
jgi:arylsulfatase